MKSVSVTCKTVLNENRTFDVEEEMWEKNITKQKKQEMDVFVK